MSQVASEMVAPARSKPPHLPHLDGIRALAALFVVLHHAEGEVPTYGRLGFLTEILQHGHYSVTVFIILSGYCLTLPTLDSGTLRGGVVPFIRRRARRLIPPYLAALGLSIILILTLIGHKTGTKWDASLPLTVHSAVTHALLIHNFDLSQAFTINYVFWSIAVEWQIYFAFPILLAGCRRFGCWATAASTLILGYAGSFLLEGTSLAVLNPHLYGMFAIGMLAANIAHNPAEGRVKARIPWGAVRVASLLAAISSILLGDEKLADLPVAVGFGCVLVELARSDHARRWLEWRPLVAIGTFSYSLYLIHAPLLHMILVYGIWPRDLPRRSDVMLLTMVGVPLILACSYLFHLAFERPFLSRPGKLIRGPIDVPAIG